MEAKKIITVSLLAWCAAVAGEDNLNEMTDSLSSQITSVKDKILGLEESYLETKTTVDKLKQIKVSGYIQAQVRVATDTSGQMSGIDKTNYKIGKYQGGDFSGPAKSEFKIRRGRLKVAHETSLTQAVIQLDCIPGSVSIKDAYLRFSEPWLKSLAIKAGVFDRPFGFEIGYSSSTRESPERSRLFQALFPGERDLGISFEFAPSDRMPTLLQYFNVKWGVFSGAGITAEFDDARDVIGRVGLSIPVNNINLAIDAGFSGYTGNVRSYRDTTYEISNSKWAISTGKKGKDIHKFYTGGDLELYYGNIPVLGGISLRGEVIGGTQPATNASNETQKTKIDSLIYIRNFIGWYTTLVINIDPLKSQLVGKFDYYDPNVDIKGNEINNVNDAWYKTLGLGMVFHVNSYVKLMAYWDKVTNEKINHTLYSKDVNDDVFTFRIQYKF